jgi:anti-sigma regulatory factor (Ser/Thr protein kinase)
MARRSLRLSEEKVMIAAAEQSTSINEIAFSDFLAQRSTGTPADADLIDALSACSLAGIEVVSLLPGWVELRVPSDLAVISPLQELVSQLEAGLAPEVSEAISRAVREMLCNAIEYGGHLDPAALVEVKLMRLEHAFLCRIKDPGAGFDPCTLDHAAINNPDDNPVRHASVREEKGLRGGGFGILLVSQLVDELVYNERHNEVQFVKYFSN